jgi:hypothetical protein
VKTVSSGEFAVDVANKISTSIVSNMWGGCVNSAFLVDVAVTPLDGVSGTVFFPLGNVAPFKGLASGDWVPQASILVKLGTGLRGRDNRGRVYLPFIGENVLASGFISTSDASIIQGGWNTFKSNLSSGTGALCNIGVASYDRAHGGASAHFTQADDITCETPVATQRRRQSRLR